ncbi:MAG TPA: preprotein translocase subunit SecE [Verrucomicrobiales bacterium]|nr:preprotein translocase subunit SecE [Verrucomicrobiales bacterium]
MIIWLAVVLGVFAFLWYKGHLLRFAGYVRATREELKRCNWPNRQELGESTFVVMISIFLLGVFTFCADLVISFVVNAINTLR